MPNEKFLKFIDKFEGMNSFDSSNDLRDGEAQILTDLVVEGRRLKLGKELSTTNLPDTNGRWFIAWADSQDTWYFIVAIDDSTNTDLKYYSGATWGTSATFTDLFLSDITSTPDHYTVGGELRIGGSLTNYHKFIKYFPVTHRLGNATGAAETHAYIAAGLKMYKGEIEFPNENSEVTVFTSTNQDSGYDFIEGDTVEYGLSYTYDNAQESLLYTGTTDTLSAGERAALAIQITPGAGNNLSWRVTHLNIYRALNGGDFYLLTRLQTNSPDATGDYGETKTGIDWVWDTGNDRGDITVYDTGAVLTNSYTSRTGYPDFTAHDGTTEYKDDSLKAFFKVCTICQGRAIIGNVKRFVGTDLETYNDRLYFSQVGRFDSFYKTDWIDLETGDGDQVTALVEFGNEVVVFKENNMYIWNMGTRDELNWYRRASYRGFGVVGQKNAYITPYGIAFSNNNGIYLYDGSGEPDEISKKIRRDVVGDNTVIGYDTINRSILGFGINGWLWLIDLDDGFIARRTGLGEMTVKSFAVFDNDPYIIDSGGQIYNANGTPTLLGSTATLYTSGDLNFNTERNKRISRVRVRYKATSTGSPTISFGISNDFGSNYTNLTLAESSSYTTAEFYPSIYGRQFRFRIGMTVGVDVFELDSIEISGKVYRV